MIDWLNGNQGFVFAVLTTVYVLATIGIAVMAKRSNDLARKNIDTLTKLEKERLRPAIVAEIYPEIPFFCVRVVNHGQTAALDIQFDLKPRLSVLLGGRNAIPKEKQERHIGFLDDGVASLPPGASVSSVIGTFERMKETCPDLIYRGKVTYRDSSGTHFEDVLVLDARHHEGSFHVDRKTIHDVAKRLEEIKQEIQHLTSGFSKPHILVQDIKEHRAETEEFIREAREKQQGVPDQASEATSEPAPDVGQTGMKG